MELGVECQRGNTNKVFWHIVVKWKKIITKTRNQESTKSQRFPFSNFSQHNENALLVSWCRNHLHLPFLVHVITTDGQLDSIEIIFPLVNELIFKYQIHCDSLLLLFGQTLKQTLNKRYKKTYHNTCFSQITHL